MRLKNSFIDYKDIDKPFRSHVMSAIEQKLVPNETDEKAFIYHRNTLENNINYEQLITPSDEINYFSFKRDEIQPIHYNTGKSIAHIYCQYQLTLGEDQTINSRTVKSLMSCLGDLGGFQ